MTNEVPRFVALRLGPRCCEMGKYDLLMRVNEGIPELSRSFMKTFKFRTQHSGLRPVLPYDNELHETNRDGHLVFEGDFGPAPDEGLQWPPSDRSAKTYQILLDLNPSDGPSRTYTDVTNTVPVAVPALLRNWWPMMSLS